MGETTNEVIVLKQKNINIQDKTGNKNVLLVGCMSITILMCLSVFYATLTVLNTFLRG